MGDTMYFFTVFTSFHLEQVDKSASVVNLIYNICFNLDIPSVLVYCALGTVQCVLKISIENSEERAENCNRASLLKYC